MIRAGIFIGVDRTGTLPHLKDAAAGAKRMRDWAIGKGMIAAADARLITDAGNEVVRPDDIYDAVSAVVDGPGVDQLILYFAGHGVNINRSEVWLLSEAPERTSAAVNVYGSVFLARQCGIPHVAIISDACRVAAEGIQAQNVVGQDVFPNIGAGGSSKPVDQFFACLLGRTSAEIRNPATAAAGYSALYTQELIAALSGERADALQPGEDGDLASYVRVRALQRHLEEAIPRIVAARGLEAKVNQNPDAIITSENQWLARFDATPAPAPAAGAGPPAPPPRMESAPADEAAPSPTMRGMTNTLYRAAVGGDLAVVEAQLRSASAAPPGRTEGPARDDERLELARNVEHIASAFGPVHFETGCGIKLRGTRIVEAFATRAQVELLGDDGDLVRTQGIKDGSAASVLLRFGNGNGTVVPVVQDFITALTFDDGELVDVAFEPSAYSWRWDMYQDKLQELRTLRAVAASASLYGRFRLDEKGANRTAGKMQYAKGLDPGMAIYAAYAYHEYDLDPVNRIAQMAQWLGNDIGSVFFDLELLARRLQERAIDPQDRIVPFVPLLSQGWSLLRANRVRLHPALDGLEATVRESLWSLYAPEGVEKLRHALSTREVR